MSLMELFILAVGLSMDAFAVSICKGLSVGELQPRHSLICGVYFGGFQALMPLLGWLLGRQFQGLIESIDHWIAFVLLGLIGFNMVREALGDDAADSQADSSFGPGSMLPLAIATSIDALAVGVTLAFLEVHIVPAVSFIGWITLILSAVGVKIGHVFGLKYKSKAECFGGIVLIAMGLKILIQHLFLGG